MTKTELLQRLASAYPFIHARDIRAVADVIFGEVAAALARGDRVELRGFGTFSVRRRKARVGRNPRT
jgi:integration host factor subunit beta